MNAGFSNRKPTIAGEEIQSPLYFALKPVGDGFEIDWVRSQPVRSLGRDPFCGKTRQNSVG